MSDRRYADTCTFPVLFCGCRLLAAGGGVQDAVTYGGTNPGITEGVGLGNIDKPIESRYGLSRWPDAYDTNNNTMNWQASYVDRPPLIRCALTVLFGAQLHHPG